MKLARLMPPLAGCMFLISAMTSSQAAETVYGGGNLRSGPGVWHSIIMWVPQGQYVRVRSCQDWSGWCSVRVNGVRGWMNRHRLTMDSTDAGNGEEPIGSGGGSGGQVPSVEPGITITILGPMVDRPGYCYGTTRHHKTVIVRCRR